jgi:hypothetical protein
VAVEHRTEGVAGGQEGDAVRVEGAALDDKGDVGEGGVVDVLLLEGVLEKERKKFFKVEFFFVSSSKSFFFPSLFFSL